MSELKTNLEAILQEKQDKIIPANIKKDVQIFDVIGTYEGSGGTDYKVKLFETKEEMQADENAQEGDLAVVYRSENNNMEAKTQTQFIVFPETVVLSEQITKDIYTNLIAVDVSSYFSVQIQLNSTSLKVVSSDLNYNIKYSSSDGLTYTRTSFSNEEGEPLSNPIDLGTMVHPEPDLEWNSAYGYFLLVPTKPFEGLYEYQSNTWKIAESQLTASSGNLYNSIAYGKDGVIEGELGTNVSDSFADINAQLVYDIQQAYENMSPKVLSDYEDIDTNIRFVPTKQDGTPLLDTSNLTTTRNLFNGCEYLTSIPLLDTSNVLDMYGMFFGCKNLKKVPNLNTTKVTNMGSMFGSCKSLSTIPELDTSNVTNMRNMVAHCNSLTTIPQFDTSKVTDMSYMFFVCSGLVTMPSLNTSSVTNMLKMFTGCTSLSDDSLNTILDMCAKATNVTSNKTLKYIGLTSIQATKCMTLSNYEAFTAAGWTTGY